jgi:hypothetical protein
LSYTYSNKKTNTASKVAKISKAVKARANGSHSMSQDYYGGNCLQLEMLYRPDSDGVIYADIVIDKRVLGKHKCLVSSRVKKVEGNVEIGPSAYLRKVVLTGLEVVVGSLALLGVINDHSNNAPTFHADELQEVHEFLQIRYNGLNTLDLPSLTFVGRTLELKDNPHLQKFDFPVLQEVGLHLIIQDNPNLYEISLPKLKTIRWDLWIQYNTHLETIDTPELTYIGEDYELHYCGDLINIRHPQLVWIGEDLEVYSLISIETFHLPKLEYVGEDLEFDNAPQLNTIELPELRRIDEDLTISSLPNLEQLVVPNLEEVGEDFEFVMVGLPRMHFPSLHLIESDTLITEMPNLKSIELPEIAIMEGGLEVNGCHQLKRIGKFISMLHRCRIYILIDETLIYPFLLQIYQWKLSDLIPRNSSKECTVSKRCVFAKAIKSLKIVSSIRHPQHVSLGKSGKGSWKEDSCGTSSKQGNGIFGGWKPNPVFEDWKKRGRRKLGSDSDQETEQEQEIDQRFYITGCNTLEIISLDQLKSITADTMLIFGLPKLEQVHMPIMSHYKVEEDDPDGLELFAIASNPKLDTIVLSEELNRPKLYSFVANAKRYPTVGPKWAFSGGDVVLPLLKKFFYESLCPNDDDHHTESDWERQFCHENDCQKAAKIKKEAFSQDPGECVSLKELYEESDGIIHGSITITHSDLSCITCEGVQDVQGCIEISNNEKLRVIGCESLTSIEGSLIIRNNPRLSSLDVENVNDLGGIGLYVVANRITSISIPDLIYTNTIHIASNFDLKYVNFGSLHHTLQHLHFNTNPSLAEISLPSLEAIGVGYGDGGDLHLQGNTAIKRYSFPKLELVGEDVEMFYSPWLEEVSFPKLQTVKEDFELYYFLGLEVVQLHELKSVGEDIEIWDLAAARLISLPKLDRVGEDFEVFDCLLLENLSIPSLQTVEEDFDFYVNREITFLHAPKLKHVWEDIQMFGNDHLIDVSFPVLEDIGFKEGGGFLITTNRMLKKLHFPSLILLGKNRGDNEPSSDGAGDFGYCYPGRDGDEALFLYSAIVPKPFILNRNRPFMVCDNANLESIDMSNLRTLDSGGFFFEANPRLESIDVSRLNELGELTYFIIRLNPNLRQGASSIGGDLSHSDNAPLLSNLQCNSPDFCVEPQVPEWLGPVCQTDDYNPSDRKFCPTDSTFPMQMCDSRSTCADAYYLWARENDYDFEENTVQISGPPQYSAVEWKRKQRYVRG